MMNSVSVPGLCVEGEKKRGFTNRPLFYVRNQWANRLGRGARVFCHPEGQHILIRWINLKEGYSEKEIREVPVLSTFMIKQSSVDSHFF